VQFKSTKTIAGVSLREKLATASRPQHVERGLPNLSELLVVTRGTCATKPILRSPNISFVMSPLLPPLFPLVGCSGNLMAMV
jgi:hypothetical protein